MKKDESISRIYDSGEEIKKIVDKLRKYKFSDLKKKKHYELSVSLKDVDEKLIENHFSNFDNIKMIIYRERKSGYNNYDFFYIKSKTEYVLYAISLDREPPELINAFPVYRSFNNFRKFIIKNYGKKMI